VYVLEPDAISTNDWRADGHRWENNGISKLPRSRPVISKTYFYLKIDSGVTKAFIKSVYMLYPHSDNGKILIHYIGDSTLSKPSPHGNANKQTKLYFRTKPSVIRKMEDNVKTGEPPGKIYKQEVSHSTGNIITDQPRNIKQVQNIKAKISEDNRLSRDAITNIHELAYSAPGFIT
jgi:hypothetical protein